MKISNGYFKHPLTGEIIKPGEMYQEFNKSSTIPKHKDPAVIPSDVDNESKLPSSQTNINYLSDLSVSELKKLAKESKIPGYSTMNKDELVSTIGNLKCDAATGEVES